VRTAYLPTCNCVFCGANGFGETGWTDVCPTCQSSPARQSWYFEMTAIAAAMKLEAIGRGLSTSHVAVTQEIAARWRELGPRPG
jgi:hypothetical protein